MTEHKPASAFIACLLLLSFTTSYAQQNQPANNQDVQIINAPVAETPLTPERYLPNALGEWRASRASKSVQGNALVALTDKIVRGDAIVVLSIGEVFREYGVEKMVTRTYVKGATQHTVEVYGLRTWAGAYGLHTFFQLKPAMRSFHAGRYTVRIVGDAVDEAFFNAVKDQLTEMSSRVPNLATELPKPVEQLHYLWGGRALSQNPSGARWKEAMSFTGGTEAVIADYANGSGKMNLILAEYQTPQFATDGLATLENLVKELPDKEQVLVKRIGNYIVVADHIQDRAAAESLIKQIRYRKEIYWEGKKYSNIPLEFRAPDRTGLKEAAETAAMIVRAFYWIGILLVSTIILGIVIGTSVFYWRRYQRRKLGLDDLFSDAGGSIRLNLDGYLLEANTEKQKLLKEAE